MLSYSHNKLLKLLFSTLTGLIIAFIFQIQPSFALTKVKRVKNCENPSTSSCTEEDILSYSSDFFSRYNPVTALDMIQRIPGFTINPGVNVRGFGGAGGNILIDGKRPSTKSAGILDLLSRIGANNVARIDLIRSGARGLDTNEPGTIVNVIRKESSAGRTESPWKFTLLQRLPGGLRPQIEASSTHRLENIDLTIGAKLFGISFNTNGMEYLANFAGPNEVRVQNGLFKELGGGINLQLESIRSNGDTFHINVDTEYFEIDEELEELRHIDAQQPNMAEFSTPLQNFNFEIGADYEHLISNHITAKLISLFRQSNESIEDELNITLINSQSNTSLFASKEKNTESIIRGELNWLGWKDHTISFGVEGVQNSIDSAAKLFVGIDGAAPVMVNIEGANTKVTERRSELSAKDSWKVTPMLTIDTELALEASKISQSGDFSKSRSFFYVKPSLRLNYSFSDTTQIRLSAQRKVNQLSFRDFVSSVNFQDDDVDFGNPDLQPQRIWSIETAIEHRFGEFGVFQLSGFYNRIEDVEDLLPVSGQIEVPGNIGDGELYGVRANVTVPLDLIGLESARLEANTTIQDSKVRDPVTGLIREFSSVPKTEYNFKFRQDLPSTKVSWGWNVSNEVISREFGLDEVTAVSTQPKFGAFIETTPISGFKIQLSVDDIGDQQRQIDRSLYSGARGLSSLQLREQKKFQDGRTFRLIFSGIF